MANPNNPNISNISNYRHIKLNGYILYVPLDYKINKFNIYICNCSNYNYNYLEFQYNEERPTNFEVKLNPIKKTDFVTSFNTQINKLYNDLEYPIYFDNFEQYLESKKPK